MSAAPHSILLAFSRGRASRRDVADALGEPVSFGRLLMLLGEHGLPLPRYRSDPDSPGRKLLRKHLQMADAERRLVRKPANRPKA